MWYPSPRAGDVYTRGGILACLFLWSLSARFSVQPPEPKSLLKQGSSQLPSFPKHFISAFSYGGIIGISGRVDRHRVRLRCIIQQAAPRHGEARAEQPQPAEPARGARRRGRQGVPATAPRRRWPGAALPVDPHGAAVRVPGPAVGEDLHPQVLQEWRHGRPHSCQPWHPSGRRLWWSCHTLAALLNSRVSFFLSKTIQYTQVFTYWWVVISARNNNQAR